MDGIAGIYSQKDGDLVDKIFLATGQLQHRGKASAGIAVATNKDIYIQKGLGRIGDVIHSDLRRTYSALGPVAAIGNVGYTKRHNPEATGAEPIEIHPRGNSEYRVVLTMDGYLIREEDLKKELEEDYHFNTSNKTEVMGALLHKCITEEGVNFDAGERFFERVRGRATFGLVALVNDGRDTYLLAMNDERGFEPFCYGDIDGNFVVSSESCSHRRLGGFIEREYSGGEMTICSSKDKRTTRLIETKLLPDVFQGVYFGFPGSIFQGKEIFQIRREFGHMLIERYGTLDVDLVVPNPDSGWGVSIGIGECLCSRLREMAFEERNREIKVKDIAAFERLFKIMMNYPAGVKLAQAVRTFQEGEQRRRASEVGIKFGTIDSLVRDRRVAMGDDSIVRGSVSEGGSIWSVFNAGARHLDFLVSYGPMFFPSFKEWWRGEDCLRELAVQRAFQGRNPYDKNLDEINEAVSELIRKRLAKDFKTDKCFSVNVRYNDIEDIRKITGDGSFQALDASYPIDERFWPDWLKKEVEKSHKNRLRFK